MRLKNILILCGAAIFLAACSTAPKPYVEEAPYAAYFNQLAVMQPYNATAFRGNISPVDFAGMGSHWQHERTLQDRGAKVDIFVPYGENYYNWTRQIRVTQTITNGAAGVDHYYSNVVKPTYAARCYYSKNSSKILYKNKFNLVFEYQVKNCGKKPNQIIIGRVMRSQNALSSIAYSVKASELSDMERTDMVHLVTNATV
ncbi:MAG: hypothetical protein JXR42_01785 [Gammaproteobacteria bacterium]|nr:hypothetical protein [Gammaproteobacteria bacterium]